jgi:phage gpG-like protein
MAGAGIEVKLDDEYQRILDALKKASAPQLQKLAHFAGSELFDISMEAFKNEADPVTGTKWPKLKSPRADGSTRPVLQMGGQLKRSLTWNGFPDGSVIFGSNMEYARIHQQGGKTKAHEIRPYNARALYFNGRFAKKVNHPGSNIPARPYMGVPKDFDRKILSDPSVLDLLGLGGQ